MMHSHRLAAALGFLLLAACSAPGTAPPAASAFVPALSIESKDPVNSPVLDALPAPEKEQAALQSGSIMGWAAGRSLSVAELLTEWHGTDPGTFWLVLEKLVTARLAAAEGERMALKLAPEALALRLDLEQQSLRSSLQAQGISLTTYAQEEYGQSAEVFMRGLRGAVERQMLIERVTRAWVFSNDWRRLRMIVVEDEKDMAQLRDRLTKGEGFASLAKELSLDGSAEDGGLLPFLVREVESPLSRHAFSQDLGTPGEPFVYREKQVLVLVEENHPARMKQDWNSLGPDVEASLLDYPLTNSEFAHWKVNMEQRYPIDVQALLELLSVKSAG